jgi:hypothetical protein
MSNLANQIRAYAYQQYSDDPNITAWFAAYNFSVNYPTPVEGSPTSPSAQNYLDLMNNLNLPNYSNKTGDLLNWVAENIYGEIRHSLPIGTSRPVGLIDTYAYDEETSNSYRIQFSDTTTFTVGDGVFKSIVQWNIFKGDGFQFTVTWLKRRVHRFLNGNPFSQNTFDVSVTFTTATDVVITVPAISTYGTALQAAVASRTVLLPFQYQFSVVLA